MDQPVVVVSGDEAQTEAVCRILEMSHYPTIALHSLADLKERIGEKAGRIVILDLDTLPVTNRFVMELRQERPGLPIIGLSTSRFHPELGEAMSRHISACLGRPPDRDELIYCVRSFCGNEMKTDEESRKEGDSNHAEKGNHA